MVISSLSQNMNFCVVTSSLSPKTELITDASTLCFQLTAGHSLSTAPTTLFLHTVYHRTASHSFHVTKQI